MPTVQYSQATRLALSTKKLSDIYYRLKPESKARFIKKITYINREDPYAQKKDDFSKDILFLPALRLVLMLTYQNKTFRFLFTHQNTPTYQF